MRKILASLTLVAVLFVPAISYANWQNGVGLGVGGMFNTNQVDGTGRVVVSFRYLEHTPLELEASYSIARGVEVICLIHMFHSRYFNFHLLDLGAYFPLNTTPFNNPQIDRVADIVVGTGVDIQPWRNLVISLGARFYITNPKQLFRYATNRVIDTTAEVIPGFDGAEEINSVEDAQNMGNELVNSVENAQESMDSLANEGISLLKEMIYPVVFLDVKWYF